MSYPPPNPYDPGHQQHYPGYGQPSPQPQHYSTDADPYSRPDPYAQNPYGNSPMSVPPGSVPPGATPPGHPPPPPANPFQPGQPAPPPPGGSSNTPLLVTLVIVVVAVAAGAIILGVTLSGGDDGDDIATGSETTEAAETAEETTEAVEETTEPEPVEETSASDEPVYRLPEEEECIENVDEGFYVVPCDSETAYWLVLHIEKNPDDPDPEDEWHSTAGHNACQDYDYDNYYFTDTAVSAGRDWDPDIDSITAIYCVSQVG